MRKADGRVRDRVTPREGRTSIKCATMRECVLRAFFFPFLLQYCWWKFAALDRGESKKNSSTALSTVPSPLTDEPTNPQVNQLYHNEDNNNDDNNNDNNNDKFPHSPILRRGEEVRELCSRERLWAAWCVRVFSFFHCFVLLFSTKPPSVGGECRNQE